jgi:hypothetical protein
MFVPFRIYVPPMMFAPYVAFSWWMRFLSRPAIATADLTPLVAPPIDAGEHGPVGSTATLAWSDNPELRLLVLKPPLQQLHDQRPSGERVWFAVFILSAIAFIMWEKRHKLHQ